MNHREFFFWGGNGDESLASITDLDNATFDSRIVRRATPIREALPDTMRYIVGSGKLPDYINSPSIGPIVSERMLSALDPVIKNTCQVIGEFPVFAEATGKRISGYCLLNPLQAISVSPDRRRKEFTDVFDTEVDPNRIPESLHIFRPKELLVSIIVSDEFVRICTKNKFLGMGYELLKSRTGTAAKKSK